MASLRRPAERELSAFLHTLYDFVEGALASGGSVLVHCLAGAHRAGTTGSRFFFGCLLLMKLVHHPPTEAVATAKKLRSAIDLIGRFPTLLGLADGFSRRLPGGGIKRTTWVHEQQAPLQHAEAAKLMRLIEPRSGERGVLQI